ncbi:phage tail assembly chaperone [Yokenella regensburgei]|uniref:phage tail assembly chaperone n=1 Tax=Yokenella regensburgei TaxID=158877 RepID=UPI003EDA7119
MEFDIKGARYNAAKLSVFDQLKVSRKLLPILAGMLSDFGTLKGLLPVDGRLDNAKLGALSPLLETALPRIAQELSDLSEEDTNAIIHPCLSVVSRQHMKGWVPVFSQGELSFDDIDLFTMLQLVARVVADSLGNFLPEPPTSETQDPPQA